MKKKRIQYNELNEEVYNIKNWKLPHFLIIALILFFIGFLFNLALEEKIRKSLSEILGKNESCPILFEKLNLAFFPPKIKLQNVIVEGSCFNHRNNNLPLEEINFGLILPSFSPLGIKFKFHIQDKNLKLNAYPILGFNSQYLMIEESFLNSEILKVYSEDFRPVILGGFQIEANLTFKSGFIEEGNINLKSKNFILPAQNLKGFDIMTIPLNQFKFEANFENKSLLKITQFTIGGNDRPLLLNLKGPLNVIPENFLGSSLNLSGTLKLAPDFLANFSFLKLFLPNPRANGIYNMKLTGPLNNLSAPKFE